MKQTPLRLLAFMLAAAGVLLFGTRADAALVMTIDDGVNPLISIMDNMAGDTDPAAGVITFAGATAGIPTNSITGFGGQSGNSAFLDVLALHSTAMPAGPGGSLTITLSQDGFVLPFAGGATLNSTVGGTTNRAGTLSSSALVDVNNALPYATGPTTSLGPLTGPLIGGITNTGFVYNGGPFSLTRVIDVTIGSNETMSYNSFAEVTVVPEPATMAYLGLGLGALALRRRRRSA